MPPCGRAQPPPDRAAAFFVLEQGIPARRKAAGLAAEFQLGRTGDENRAETARHKVPEPPVVYVYNVPSPKEETTKESYGSICIAAHSMGFLVPERVQLPVARLARSYRKTHEIYGPLPPGFTQRAYFKSTVSAAGPNSIALKQPDARAHLQSASRFEG